MQQLTTKQQAAWDQHQAGKTAVQAAEALGIAPNTYAKILGVCRKKLEIKQVAEEKKQVKESMLIPFDFTAPEGLDERSNYMLQKYREGFTGDQIAKGMGISAEAFYMYLLRNAKEAWQDHQAARSLTRLERATEKLESSSDAISLARAREELKAAQWNLERTCRRIYGPSVELKVSGSIDIKAAIAEARARVPRTIEHDAQEIGSAG